MGRMGICISQVDAFTDRRFAGNPAAVCVLAEPAADRWMQSVAAEMNLSETAFARRLGTGSQFSLRWFTPRVEGARRISPISGLTGRASGKVIRGADPGHSRGWAFWVSAARCLADDSHRGDMNDRRWTVGSGSCQKAAMSAT